MATDYNFYLNLSYVSVFSVCVPLIVGFVFIRHLKPNFIVLLYLLCADLLTELIAHIFQKYNLHNLFIYRSFTLVQFVMLSVFFIKTLSPSKIALFIKIFIFVFFGIALFDLYKNGFNTPDDLSLAVSSVLLMIYSLLTFNYIIQNPVHTNILSMPLFWFITAVLIYFSSGLFLFIFSGYVLNFSNNFHYELWSINSLLNIIFNLLIAIGFWKTKHRQIS